MRPPERQEELEVIANEIFEALSCERYEPSERGAGWTVTDAGTEAVVEILARAKAKPWRVSPAERRKVMIARARQRAKVVAKRLLGEKV